MQARNFMHVFEGKKVPAIKLPDDLEGLGNSRQLKITPKELKKFQIDAYASKFSWVDYRSRAIDEKKSQSSAKNKLNELRNFQRK